MPLPTITSISPSTLKRSISTLRPGEVVEIGKSNDPFGDNRVFKVEGVTANGDVFGTPLTNVSTI